MLSHPASRSTTKDFRAQARRELLVARELLGVERGKAYGMARLHDSTGHESRDRAARRG
ncbi:MAG: hypothetical protein KC766_30805 [Myxococcales bacterium]|nr:hypothetical protein [Myxococcales bacterium]